MTTFTTEDRLASMNAFELADEMEKDLTWVQNDEFKKIVTNMLRIQGNAIIELQVLFDKALKNWAKDSERAMK